MIESASKHRVDALSSLINIDMKKILIVLVLVLTVAGILSSCGSKKPKTREEMVEAFRGSLTVEDTTRVMQLCDNCMELLKGNKVEEALDMLYTYDDSLKQVSPLTEEQKQRYRRIFKIFPVVEYKRAAYSFQLEGINDIKYDIIFAHEDNPAENGVPKTSFMFNPVKLNDVWYLSVKQADQEIDEEMR